MILISKKRGILERFADVKPGDTFMLPEDENVFRVKLQGTGVGPNGPVPQMVTLPGGFVGNLHASCLVNLVDVDVELKDRV